MKSEKFATARESPEVIKNSQIRKIRIYGDWAQDVYDLPQTAKMRIMRINELFIVFEFK